MAIGMILTIMLCECDWKITSPNDPRICKRCNKIWQ